MRFACWLRLQANTHTRLLHGNSGYANAPPCYIIRTLLVLFALLHNRVNWYDYVGRVKEWWQEKAEAQGRKPIPVPLCLSQIPH